MVRFRPSQPNGWHAHVSPDGRYVAYGNGHAYVVDLEAAGGPVEHDVMEGYVFGWLDATTLYVGLGASLWAVDVEDWTRQAVHLTNPTYAEGNVVKASKGHWATWHGALGRYVVDGRIVTPPVPVAGLTFDGEWMAFQVLDGALPGVMKIDGTRFRIVEAPDVNVAHVFNGGYLAYASRGVCCLSFPDGHTESSMLRVSRPIPESIVTLVESPGGALWLWSWRWDEDGAYYVMGRPYGDNAIVQLRMPGLDLDVQAGLSGWTIAGTGDRGDLHVYHGVPYDAPREELVLPPEPVEPIPPVPDSLPRIRPLWVGWYKDQAGAGPGNCHFFEGAGGGILDMRGQVIATPYPPEAPDPWCFRTPAGEVWRYCLTFAGMSLPGPETRAECEAWAREAARQKLAEFASDPVVFVGLANDRRRSHANDSWPCRAGLSDIMRVWYEVARDEPRVKALLFFARDREGGAVHPDPARCYPELLGWADAIVRATSEPQEDEDMTPTQAAQLDAVGPKLDTLLARVAPLPARAFPQIGEMTAHLEPYQSQMQAAKRRPLMLVEQATLTRILWVEDWPDSAARCREFMRAWGA